MNKLSPAAVRHLNEPGRYGDGGGLWLQVSKQASGRITKSWLFRYSIGAGTISRAGKRYTPTREMGLGSLDTFSLKEARERARRCRQLLADNIDPIEQRRAGRQAALAASSKAISFREAAERYIEAHRAAWRNEKHACQWRATLSSYAFPIFGDLAIAAVDTGLVMKALEPIWTVKPETASRLRGRIERVLDWATVRGYRKGENPARWRGHLQALLPARTKVRKVRNQPAMAYAELPAFLAALREREGMSARALEFTILTAARTGETIGATWAEIDLDNAVWTVPAERTKAHREHRVPLSGRAVEILRTLPREAGNAHVFIGARKGAGLSNMAMLELFRGMDGDGLTVHGFRSTFRDWAAESTNFPREVAEQALAHVLADKVEAAYRRGDLFEKRRRLMEAWAGFGARPPAEATVTPITAASQ